MTRRLLFWILFLIVIVFDLYRQRLEWIYWQNDLPILVLILLLGWGVYGPPVSGDKP